MTRGTRRRPAWCCGAIVALAALASGQETLVSPWNAPQHLRDDFRPRTTFGDDTALTWIEAGDLGVAIRGAPGVGVQSLRHLGTQTEFVSASVERSALWEIELRKRDASIVTIDSANATVRRLPAPGVAEDGRITMRWQTGFDVSVAATVEWDEGSAFTRWRIRVDNASKELGIWRVAFPILPGLGHPGRTDVATAPVMQGDRVRLDVPAREGLALVVAWP